MVMIPENSRSSADVISLQSGRDSSGRFTSDGNPGRVPGSKNRVSNEALRAVRDMKDEAIAQLQSKLIAGDWSALQFVLERILPKGRPVEINDATPQAILDALSTGQLTTDEAKNLATVLEKLASISEIETIKQKLDELEKAVRNNADR